MPDPSSEPALTDPTRKLPAAPEAPDEAEPPGAEHLQAEARVSYEPAAEAVGSNARTEEQDAP